MVRAWHEYTADEINHARGVVPHGARAVRALGPDHIGGVQKIVAGHEHWFINRNDHKDAVFVPEASTPVWDSWTEARVDPAAAAWVREGVLPPKEEN